MLTLPAAWKAAVEPKKEHGGKYCYHVSSSCVLDNW